MIAIAITTVPERAKLLQKALQMHRKYLPPNAEIHVNTDHNKEGIARAKNRCIEWALSTQAEHIFLFDDDCYPVKNGWHLPFIEGGQSHSMAIFDKLSNGISNGNIYKETANGYDRFINPCGICMYYTKACLQAIGGMDIQYGTYGHEHVGHSYRAHNAGYCDYRFQSPVGIMSYLYSLDQHRTTSSTIDPVQRSIQCEIGRPVIREEKTSREWKPYHKEERILTAYFTSQIDKQRGIQWKPDNSQLHTLRNSTHITNVLFTDVEFSDIHPKVITKVPRGQNIYNYRFKAWLEWLTKYRDYCNVVWLLDSTDTEVYQLPEIEPGWLYVGSETMNARWLSQQMDKIPKANTMLNCGIIIGDVDTLIPFLQDMVKYMEGKSQIADMGAINHILLNEKKHNFVTGYPLHTVFKKNEGKESGAFVRHK